MKNKPGEGGVAPRKRLRRAARTHHVDEEDGDWEEVSARHEDAGDGDGLDIERLWMAHAEQHLQLVVVNMHPPCCNAGPEDGESSSNAQRQRVVDGVVAFLRDLKEGDGAFEVAPDTPIS